MVNVSWRALNGDYDPGWDLSGVLYAYVVPGGEIAYIGKAGYVSVRRRWNRSSKAGFWGDLERERGIGRHAVLVGSVDLRDGCRLTDKLLSDIESLLIATLRPWGNIQAIQSRMSRPGLRVRCRGGWPYSRRDFVDEG